MQHIAAIHKLEALSTQFAPGSDESRALQAGIEALWEKINAEAQETKRQERKSK